jgi:hypothetical protein
MAQPVAVALAITFAELGGQPFGIGGRLAGTQQAAHDLGRGHVPDFRLQGVAAEQVNLFELRKQAIAGAAASRTLQLVHGQELAVIASQRMPRRRAVSSQSGWPRCTSSTNR